MRAVPFIRVPSPWDSLLDAMVKAMRCGNPMEVAQELLYSHPAATSSTPPRRGDGCFDWKLLLDWAALPCELMDPQGNVLRTCQLCRLPVAYQSALLRLVGSSRTLIDEQWFEGFLSLLEANALNEWICAFLLASGRARKSATRVRLEPNADDAVDNALDNALDVGSGLRHDDAVAAPVRSPAAAPSQSSVSQGANNDTTPTMMDDSQEESPAVHGSSGGWRSSQEQHPPPHLPYSQPSQPSGKLDALVALAGQTHSELSFFKDTALPSELLSRIADLIMSCNPEQLEELCTVLELDKLPDVPFFSVADSLLARDFGVQITTLLARRLLLPRIQSLRGSVPRVLLNTIVSLSVRHARAVVSGVIHPLLAGDGSHLFESAQSSFVVRLIKESPAPEFVSLLVESVCGDADAQKWSLPWTDCTMEVLLAAMNANCVVRPVSLKAILFAANAEKDKLALSLKFASLLHAILTKHGDAIVEGRLQPLAEHLLASNSTFMAKAARAALGKLQR